jgi:hypothetical protein
MERREFIKLAICSIACGGMGMSLFKSINVLKGATGSINNITLRDKAFSMELEPEVLKFYRNYAGWLRTLTERLGYERTLKVWKDAYRNYDETKLGKILSSGWILKNDNEPNDENEKINDIVRTCFPSPVEGLTKDEARQIIEVTPPVKQIRKYFPSSLNLRKDITAYDSLFLSYDGPALLIEALIKNHKKEGELIAYDFIRERRVNGAEKNPLSIEQLISVIGSITKSEKPNLMTSALTTEIISSSNKEIVMHVKECEWARYFKGNHPAVGYLMACSTDEAAYRTANKSIRLQRTGTIMEGNRICDFRVYAVF